MIDVYNGNDFEQLKSKLRWNAFRQPLSTNQISISGKLDQLPWSRVETDEYYDPR